MHKSGQDAFIGLCIVCLLLVAITAVASATTAEDEQLADIQNAIEEKGAQWTAGKTAVSGLSAEEKELLFGLEIDSLPADIPVISPPTRLMAIPYGTFDWRNKDGQNWITSVKNQGSCGSCWAFAAVGAVEAVINIERNDPDIDIDLSEQHLVSDCCAYCGDCGGGSPWYALYYIKDNGVPDEACFSYQASNSPCTPCSDWQDRAWEIGSYYGIEPNTTDAYKWGLGTYGPMIVVLRATDDFLYYTGGIYEPVLTEDWGAVPNHAVVLVGYNDTEQYWIIKNSWGLYSGWGEEGYVKVGYGVLEQYDYALVVDNTVGPAPSAPVVSSPTHPNESAWYCSGNVTFTWTTPSDPSGIACYSYTLDQSPTTTPDETCDTTDNSKSYASLSDGTKYFHVRAKDNDNNWGSAGHYRVMIENCDDLDGWYCNGDIKELRDYYCSGGNCTFNVTESENCSASDDWVDTGSTRWMNDTENACVEKEQQEQAYHDYFCAAGGNCSFNVSDSRWVDTGTTRDKPDGSDCGCTANNTMMKCYNGTCSDTGMCNSTICQANAACDGKGPGGACGAGSTCNYSCECQGGSAAIFDTGQKVTPYPSITGTHTGVIRPSKTLVVSKLYTYSCPGTGGHTEYARIWNSSWEGAEAHWEGYVEDWHNISFNKTFTLLEGETYNYTIRTGSYPQMHLTNALQTPSGWINCTAFIDGNGKAYNDRIPAIRLA
ncbi:MAG TPA: C1 family peptidase [Desulfobacteria bacterium]|nr:C1 family peptidase [Desulfobacteria bacterium]